MDGKRMFKRRCSLLDGRRRMTALIACFLLLVTSLHAERRATSKRRANADSWYTRYEAYHPYCSTPDQVAKREIPWLNEGERDRTGETRLVHVTAILRHGARTPWKAGLNCWEGYDTNPATAVWDCNLTTFLSPPPPERVSEEGGVSDHEQAMFLFEKRYDALHNPEKNLSNWLRGTCQLGQLLMQGYEQELYNGKYLRTAYVYDESKYDHNARMRLLDITSGQDGHYVWDDIYYRVDDDQRTLMSGQVVLRGLMGHEIAAFFQKKQLYPVIPLHVADRGRDIVDPNEFICPRLTEIRERNQQSSTFQQLDQSAEAKMLRAFQRDVLKVPDPSKDMDAVDCLMTTMCTDRPLPATIDDYRSDGTTNRQQHEGHNETDYGTDLFQRLFDFNVEGYVYNLKANDAEYSKLSMGPLWFEIMKNIYPFIHDDESGTDRVKLALFAGHDTTIMPLLVSLGSDLWGDKDWPPYASMVVLEIHEMNIDGNTDRHIYRSDFAFRLLYNGKVLTSKIKDCPDDLELCDADILVQHVQKFAVLDADCQRKHPEPVQYTDTVSRAKEILSTTEGVVGFILLVAGSVVLGAVLAFVYLTGGLPSPGRPASALYTNEQDGIALTMNGNGERGYRDVPDAYSETERAEINATLT